MSTSSHMEEEMEEKVDFLQGIIPQFYNDIPLRALQISTRQEICLHLDIPKKVKCEWAYPIKSSGHLYQNMCSMVVAGYKFFVKRLQ